MRVLQYKSQVYSSSSEGSIRVWDLNSREPIKQFCDVSTDGAFDLTNEYTLISYRNKSNKLIIRNIETGELLLGFPFYDTVDKLILALEGKLVYILSEGGVSVWDTVKGVKLKDFPSTLGVTDIYLNDDESILYTMYKGKVGMWNIGLFNFVISKK